MPKILLCTLGASWGVVPEIYAFLAPQRLPLYEHHPRREDLDRIREELALQAPDEIWICTTDGPTTQQGIQNLFDWQSRLDAPLVLRVWQAAGAQDLANQPQCEHMQELILRAALLARETTQDQSLVLSLAGGRKTMSADLQWAGQMFGCQALVHVVGSDPLPRQLFQPDVMTLLEPLPQDLASHITPIVTTQCRRSELLDVCLDQRGPVQAARFPLPLPPPNTALTWPHPTGTGLAAELREREVAGSQLLGNYLAALATSERHQNWRSLYRLPPACIDRLRHTPLDSSHSDWLRGLPKADLHRHLGGCLSIKSQRVVAQAIWDSLSATERQAATTPIEAWLHQPEWPENWPNWLRERSRHRAHHAAALLLQSDLSQLEYNLYEATEPRVALSGRRDGGFRDYERPGELSGSSLLSHPAAIAPYAEIVIQQAVDEGLAYVEFRGSPHKYGKGLKFLDRFRAAVHHSLARYPQDVRPLVRFVVIGDRRNTEKMSEVVQLAVAAKRKWNDFLAGIDIAGDEKHTLDIDVRAIAPAFEPAFEICLPITIHAGEGVPVESIWQAAYHLHADRIGHGLTIADHHPLASRFRDRGILLELCPTSNCEVVGYQDPVIPASHGYGQYPLRKMWDDGLPLTICTDNPGISCTTLANEYIVASRLSGPSGISCWEMLAMVKQAFTHAFLPADEKDRLMKVVDAAIYRRVIEEWTEQGSRRPKARNAAPTLH